MPHSISPSSIVTLHMHFRAHPPSRSPWVSNIRLNSYREAWRMSGSTTETLEALNAVGQYHLALTRFKSEAGLYSIFTWHTVNAALNITLEHCHTTHSHHWSPRISNSYREAWRMSGTASTLLHEWSPMVVLEQHITHLNGALIIYLNTNRQ